jgi:hypothetical protein
LIGEVNESYKEFRMSAMYEKEMSTQTLQLYKAG